MGWDVRYVQLDSGRCLSRHVSLHTGRMQLRFEAWSLGTMKIGRPPAGAVTFLVPGGRRGPLPHPGPPVGAGEVVMLSGGDEFDYRSAGPRPARERQHGARRARGATCARCSADSSASCGSRDG